MGGMYPPVRRLAFAAAARIVRPLFHVIELTLEPIRQNQDIPSVGVCRKILRRDGKGPKQHKPKRVLHS